MKTIATLALLLLSGVVLAASYPCRTIISTTPYYIAPTYTHTHPTVRHRDTRIITDVLQINPAYTSAYAPESYDAAAQQQLTQQLAALQLQIQELSARLAAQRLAPPPAPVNVVPPAVMPRADGSTAAPAPPPASAAALLAAQQSAAAALLLHQQQSGGPGPGSGCSSWSCAANHGLSRAAGANPALCSLPHRRKIGAGRAVSDSPGKWDAEPRPDRESASGHAQPGL